MTLTMAQGSVGGASKAGLRLCGFSSTGVFVEEVVPGSQADTSGQVQKGDQLLEIDGKTIGKPTCVTDFEVVYCSSFHI